MLGDIERKLASLVADAVAARTHLVVDVTPLDPPAAGKGTVAVGLSDVTANPGFVPSEVATTTTSPIQSRRILPLQLKAGIDFALRPAGSGATARADARALMLEDMSTVAHALADPALRNGSGFAGAGPDLGFRVQLLQLESGKVSPTIDAGLLTGTLAYRMQVDIWPPGPMTDEGIMRAIDPLIAPLPLAMIVADAAVRSGGTTTVKIAAPANRRLVDPATGARAGLRLAVTVLGDVPPNQRGSIPAGVAGNETGLRILDVTGPELLIPYQAPAGDPGPVGRIEYVAVHLATPDGGKGIFLGSAAIHLVGAP
jgi:hypothetical protein